MDLIFVVLFQKKAWVDTSTHSKICKICAKYFKSMYVAVIGGFNDRISIKDNLRLQTCNINCTNLKEANFMSWFVPEGNTNRVQAVEDGFGKDIKGNMYKCFKTWLDD